MVHGFKALDRGPGLSGGVESSFTIESPLSALSQICLFLSCSGFSRLYLGSSLTTKTIILVGSYYETVYRNYRYPTKMVVLVVNGTALLGGILESGLNLCSLRSWSSAFARQAEAKKNATWPVQSSHVAVSVSWGALDVGVLRMRALLTIFGLY